MEKMDPRELLKNIARIFERLNLPYLVTGGMAVLIWGRPRFTADIDIVIELKPSDVKNFAGALKELSKAGYVDEDIMEEMVRNGGEFNFVDGTTGVKVDFWIFDNGDFDSSRLKRRVAKEILGQKIYFTSPEDLILSKLKWYKESHSNRHLEDAESVLKISGTELDMGYLEKWAGEIGATDYLKLIENS